MVAQITQATTDTQATEIPKPSPLEVWCDRCGSWHICLMNKNARPCLGHKVEYDLSGVRTGLIPCKNPAAHNKNVCRMHGGSNTSGRPITAGGRYSRTLPTGILARFEDGLRDPTLLSLRREIALVDQALDGFLKDLKLADETDALILDQAHQFRLQSLIATRRSLVAEEWNAMQKAQQVLTVQQLNVVIARLIDILRRNILDSSILNPIMGEIKLLITSGQSTEEAEAKYQ